MDLVGRGEGEWTCCELAEGRPWGEIAGLSYRVDGRVVHNPDRPRLTAGEMLPPTRDNYFHPDWSAHSLSTSPAATWRATPIGPGRWSTSQIYARRLISPH